MQLAEPQDGSLWDALNSTREQLWKPSGKEAKSRLLLTQHKQEASPECVVEVLHVPHPPDQANSLGTGERQTVGLLAFGGCAADRFGIRDRPGLTNQTAMQFGRVIPPCQVRRPAESRERRRPFGEPPSARAPSPLRLASQVVSEAVLETPKVFSENPEQECSSHSLSPKGLNDFEANLCTFQLSHVLRSPLPSEYQLASRSFQAFSWRMVDILPYLNLCVKQSKII